MRISDWSSDVCSSDLCEAAVRALGVAAQARAVVRRGAGAGLPADRLDEPDHRTAGGVRLAAVDPAGAGRHDLAGAVHDRLRLPLPLPARPPRALAPGTARRTDHRRAVRARPLGNRSEEHTSELQSLMRISFAAFCLKKKNNTANLIGTR